MSDYDLKNIPTLDDVIEESKTDATDGDSSEREPAESDPTTDDVSRETSSESSYGENETEEPVVTKSETQTTDFDDSDSDSSEPDIHRPGPVDEKSSDTANVSVQISYDEIYDKTDGFLNDQALDDSRPYSDEAIDSIQPNEIIHSQIDPIALNTVVEDVVKQLLPDLEQQLRFLIQQALEERLPEELIQPPDSDSDADTEIDSKYQ